MMHIDLALETEARFFIYCVPNKFYERRKPNVKSYMAGKTGHH